MAIKVQTEGFFAGIKTGIRKDGQQWAALQFRCSETYKGCAIAAEQITQPNVMFFDDNLDPSQLTVGMKYHLVLGVSSSKTGVNYQLVQFKAV